MTDWRSGIEDAARRLEAHRGSFLRETPLWKLSPQALQLPSSLAAAGVEVWLKLSTCRSAAASRRAG
ncbi:MAG: hypothetical protein EOP73_25670 [Variovorax sp.]|nr:MAG: hypothetical protein EOP73_25670 [Variovorax sp.]